MLTMAKADILLHNPCDSHLSKSNKDGIRILSARGSNGRGICRNNLLLQADSERGQGLVHGGTEEPELRYLSQRGTPSSSRKGKPVLLENMARTHSNMRLLNRDRFSSRH